MIQDVSAISRWFGNMKAVGTGSDKMDRQNRLREEQSRNKQTRPLIKLVKRATSCKPYLSNAYVNLISDFK